MALLLAQIMAQDWCPKMFADLDCTDSGTPPTLCLPHRIPTNLAQVSLWSARSCSHPLICKAPPAPRPAGALSLSLLPCPALPCPAHPFLPAAEKLVEAKLEDVKHRLCSQFGAKGHTISEGLFLRSPEAAAVV